MIGGPILQVLRLRCFSWLLGGLLASNLGAQISFVAVATHLFALSNSSAVVGLLGVVTLVPMLILGLLGGVIADRIGRRSIVLSCQLVAAVAAASLAVTVGVSGGSPVAVLAFAGLWAATIALSSPARISLIPLLVPREQAAAANSALTVVMTLTWTVGPLLTAGLVKAGGYGLAYGADAALGMVALLAFARVEEPDVGNTSPHRARLRDGLHVVLRTPMVALALALDGIAMVLCSPRLLFPGAASAALLGGGVETVALLFAALAGGATIGALLPGRHPPEERGGDSKSLLAMTITWGVAVVTFGLILNVGPLPSTGALLATCLAMAIAGGADARATVVRQTTVHSQIDATHMGRIQGLVFVMGVAAPRLGDTIMGTSAEITSVPTAAVMGGAACAIGAIAVTLRMRGRLTAVEARDANGSDGSADVVR